MQSVPPRSRHRSRCTCRSTCVPSARVISTPRTTSLVRRMPSNSLFSAISTLSPQHVSVLHTKPCNFETLTQQVPATSNQAYLDTKLRGSHGTCREACLVGRRGLRRVLRRRGLGQGDATFAPDAARNGVIERYPPPRLAAGCGDALREGADLHGLDRRVLRVLDRAQLQHTRCNTSHSSVFKTRDGTRHALPYNPLHNTRRFRCACGCI